MEGEQHKGSTAATGQAAPLPYPACLACPPAAGPVAPRMRTSGEADIAHAQTRLTRHGAYELTRPDHEENACHQVQKKKFQQHLPALLFFQLHGTLNLAGLRVAGYQFRVEVHSTKFHRIPKS